MVTVMASEGKTLASDGMEMFSGRDCVDGCTRGGRVQMRMRQGKSRQLKVIWP